MESIPADTFKNLIDRLDTRDVTSLKLSATTINKIINDYENENVYYKIRVGKLLGFDIPDEIMSTDWKDLYYETVDKTEIDDRIRDISEYEVFDLLFYYYEYLKKGDSFLEHTGPFMDAAIKDDNLDFYKQITHDVEELGTNFNIGELKAIIVHNDAIKILKYVLDDRADEKEAFKLLIQGIPYHAINVFKYLRDFIDSNSDNIKEIFRLSIEHDSTGIFTNERERSMDIWKLYSAETNIAKIVKYRIAEIIIKEIPDDEFDTFVFDACEIPNTAIMVLLVDDTRLASNLLNGIFYPALRKDKKEELVSYYDFALKVYSHPLLNLNLVLPQDLVRLKGKILKMLVVKIPSLFITSTYRYLYTNYSVTITKYNPARSYKAYNRMLNYFINQSPELINDEALYYELLMDTRYTNSRYALAVLVGRSDNKDILTRLLNFILKKFKDVQSIEFEKYKDANISHIIWLLLDKLL